MISRNGEKGLASWRLAGPDIGLWGPKRKTRESGFSFALGLRLCKTEGLVVECAFVPGFDVLDADD